MFNAEVKNVSGTCDSELFKLMASESDITSISVSELVNNEFTVKGYADISEEDISVIIPMASIFPLSSASKSR